MPYAVTNNFLRWARQLSELGVQVFGESLQWMEQFGHKVSKGFLRGCCLPKGAPAAGYGMMTHCRGAVMQHHTTLAMMLPSSTRCGAG